MKLSKTKFTANSTCGDFIVEDTKKNDKIKLGHASTFIEFHNNDVETIDIKPINESAFVLAWCDETLDDIYLQSFHADGSSLSPKILIDGDQSGCRNEGTPTGVAVLNNSNDISEQLVMTLYSRGTSGEVAFNITTVNGTHITSKISDNETLLTFSASVSVEAFNESHWLVGLTDNGFIDERVRYAIFNSSGNSINVGGWNASDSDVGLSKDLDVTIFDNRSFAICWHEADSSEFRFDTYMVDHEVVANEVIADTMGAFSEVECQALSNDYLVLAWIDVTQIAYKVYDFDGNVILGQQNIDTVTANAENIALSKHNSTSFIITYTDNSTASKKVAMYNVLGETILSPTQYDNNNNEPVGSASASNLFNFCLDTMVLVGGSNTVAFYSSNYTNLTGWDGSCEEAPAPLVDAFPDVTLNYPADNTITNITAVDFNCSATDDLGLWDVTLYTNLTGSWTANETTFLVGTQDSAEFNLNIDYNASILWNCLVCDITLQCNSSENNYSLNINQTFVDIFTLDLLAPVNNTITEETNITFQYSTSYANNCSLYVNSIEIDNQLTSGLTEVNNNFTTTGLKRWNVNCTDGDSGTYMFIITTAPEPFIQFCTIPLTTIGLMGIFLLISILFIFITVYTRLEILWLITGLLWIITGVAVWYLMQCFSPFNIILSIIFWGLGIFFITMTFRRF